jgi:hypothetical protein
MRHVWGRGELHRGFWCGNLRAIEQLKDRRRWEDNTKMDLHELGRGAIDWIDLRIGTFCECGSKPSGFIKCGECLDYLRAC